MRHIAFACAFALASASLFAWGPGHDVVAEAIATKLPAKYKAVLADKAKMRQFLHDSHYPDSFAALETNRFGRACTERLGAMGVKTRYGFHSYKGRAAAFVETIRAVRDNDVDRVLLLLSAYSHAVADAIALNHDPLIHLVTYGWQKEGLDIAPSIPVDAAWLKSTPRATAIFRVCADRQDVADRGRAFKEELLAIARQDLEGMKSMELGPSIIECGMRLRKDKNDPWTVERLANIYSFLVCWASSDTLRMLAACERIAASGEMCEIDFKNDFREYDREVVDFLSKRPIEKDAWTKGLLPEKGKDPSIGVAYDPTGRFGGGFFPWGDRILAAQIAGTLRASNRDAALYDVRRLCRGDVDAAKTPVLVVPANRFGACGFGSSRGELLARLGAYRKAGGKIIWIGNKPPKEVLPEISKCAKDSGVKGKYAKPALFVPRDEVQSCCIRMPSKGKEFRYVRKPEGSAGWCWYDSTTYLDGLSKNVIPVLVAEAPCGRRVVGAVCPKDGTAYISSNVLLPYVLTDEVPQMDPLDLSLDSAGASMLNEVASVLLDRSDGRWLR